MKASAAQPLVNVPGSVALAAFVDPNGKLSSTDGCIARMAVVSDGKGAAEVVVLAPPSELLESCLTDYDWLSRWNRLRVYHPPGESKQQAKASARIERLLARAMKNHLHDEDPSAANAALKKAFGRKLMEWLETENAGDTEVDWSKKLEITDVRPLDADEQEQVRDQVPAKWLPKIEDSMPFVNCIEIEGQAVRERTEGFWRRPGLSKRLGIAGIATASGLAITGFLLYRFGPRGGSLLAPRIATNSSSPTDTPGNTTTNTSSTLFTTQFPPKTQFPPTTQLPSSSLHPYEAEALKYQRALAHECSGVSGSDCVNQCHPNPEKRPEPNIDDITTLLSGYELATLRVPSGSCNDAFHRMKPQSMVKAAPGGWKTLDWSQVSGGKVICTDENGQDMTCHYFGDPFKYDLPTVWDAVNYYLKPYQCLFTDNGDTGIRLEYRGGRARGVAKWVGGDLYGFDDARAHEVGYLVTHLNKGPIVLFNKIIQQDIPVTYCDSDGPTCRTNVSEHCQCQIIELSAEATTPSGTNIRWGTVRDYFTNQTDLVKYYTLFQRKEYKLTNCHVTCWRDSVPKEHREETIRYFASDFGQKL